MISCSRRWVIVSMVDCVSGRGSNVNSTKNGNLTQRRVTRLQTNGAAPRRWAHVPDKMFYYFAAFLPFLFIVKMPLAKTQITFSRMI